MKDDNQKTFADLFSSASSVDFNDSPVTDEVKKSDSDVTFGNLFENNSVVTDDVKEDSYSETNHGDSDVSDLAVSDNDNTSSIVESNNFNFFSSNINGDMNQNIIESKSDDVGNEDYIDTDSVNSSVENGTVFDEHINVDLQSDSLQQNDNSMFFESDENKESILDGYENSHVESDKTVESVSPFFQEEDIVSSGDSNPLLLGALNLIENEKEEKMVNSIDVSKSKHFNVKIVKKKEPLFHVILGVVSYAIFIWLLLVGVVLLVYVLDIKIRAQKGDYSAPTYNAYVVLTGSMLPKIQVYDVVVTKRVEASDLKVGDVITFASADTRFLNTIITHRIIKKNYDPETKSYSFQTRGDNNNVADSALVPQNNIYGKVFLKIPKLGYLQEFLASDGGWIIVILIPCLAVISYDIVKLIKGLRRKKYKNIKIQK